MPENRRIRKTRIPMLVAIIVLATILVMLFLRKYAGREPVSPQPVPQSVTEQGIQSVTLFFSSPDGGGLVRESRILEPCSGVNECAEEVLGELINGPIGDFAPSLPETTMYHGVTLTGDTLTVDFGRELTDGMVSGSDAEMAAVYSVVNSMATNFPEVKCVRFLLDGKPMETLKGHIDLSEPLPPDYSLEKGYQPPSVPPETQRRKQ